MEGLDELLRDAATDSGLIVVCVVALLLGLRHATDPDHLAAVSTLVASKPGDGARRAGLLGLAWGLGHATTLCVFGLPIVLFGSYLPDAVMTGAELAVGALIIALATRLLVNWRKGRFHSHPHRHGLVEHRHLHPHARAKGHAHRHEPEKRLGRSPVQAYGIGLLHGMAGSAGVGVLLLAGIESQHQAIAALAILALGTAVSMAALSSALGVSLGSMERRTSSPVTAPAMGVVTALFGLWYSAGALQLVPYPL